MGSPVVDAIGVVADPPKIRVVIFINGRLVHVARDELVKDLIQKIADLEARVTALESA
ncbi:hypothetical protein PH562_16770 [Rhizobium sp. CNPSo 4062]|uniref:hypothetical protein n=1 Tax=Rhizobium sp. CNPSo 4062 TaxID=3021410 RepID=UPI00254B476B|nr:hypothetical protein [Rhizobium sp. CNPSo 4062]MDK4703906.1 hypothetical protein [Rhizobium sp. CNPSo 4062]